MATKTKAQCEPDEILAFTDAWFAARDVASKAVGLFKGLHLLATNPTDDALYRAKWLEAAQDVADIDADLQAFNAGRQGINPPTAAQVKALQSESAALANVQAKIANATTILNLFNSGMAQFTEIAP